MNHNYNFIFKTIRLEPLSLDDIKDLMTIRNNYRYFFIDNKLINWKTQKKWYKSYLKTPNDFMFSVFSENKKVGYVALYNVDIENSKAEFGRLLVHKKFLKQNIGYYTISAITELSKEFFGIKTLYCKCLKENSNALKLYLRLGFCIELESDSLYTLYKKFI